MKNIFGKNRYLIDQLLLRREPIITLIIACMLILGQIPLLLTIIVQAMRGAIRPQREGVSYMSSEVLQVPDVAIAFLILVPFALTFSLLLWYGKKRWGYALEDYITFNRRLDWQRLWFSFKIVFGVLIGVLLGSILVNWNGRYIYRLFTWDWFLFLPIALLFLPMQAALEEIFFRKILFQRVLRQTISMHCSLVISSLVFCGVHWVNPEMNFESKWVILAVMFIASMVWGYISVYDRGLEFAIGWHTANNLFIFLVCNYEGSVIPSPALLLDTSKHFHSVYEMTIKSVFIFIPQTALALYYLQKEYSFLPVESMSYGVRLLRVFNKPYSSTKEQSSKIS